ncbi:MAG: PLP-dependent aminotransferase family protein [Parasporobacterium sp.]|nr:PLP-dependent aminotransferase family protein [Parasporobacterium sp.]
MALLTYPLADKGDRPLYLYLYECVRDDIVNKKIAPGDKLPSKRVMAGHLNVSLNTVAAAYEMLATEGYIISNERSGYFAQDVSDFAKRHAPRQKYENIEENSREYFCDFKANRQGVQHFPMDAWSRCMKQASLQGENVLVTVPYNGLLKLRTTIARHLKESRDMDVSPANIIIGAGTEYLYGRLLQLLGHDAVIAMEDPGYRKLAAISGSAGNECRYIPIDDKGLRVDMLHESRANVVHVSPANHFPTGITMPIARREELFGWVNEAEDRYIIEDDYDSEFRFSGQLILPMYTKDVKQRVIYINTFSKTLVPSIRISFMVLPPALMERYVQTMNFYSCTVSSFEQYALAEFIEEGYFIRHINRTRKRLREQHDCILRELKSCPLADIADITEHNAGTHFLLSVRTEMSRQQIAERAEEQDLNLSFYSDYTVFAQAGGVCELVINYAGIDTEKIPEVVRRLCWVFETGKEI